MDKIEVGSWVTWTSQASGTHKSKVGQVAAVLEAGQHPRDHLSRDLLEKMGANVLSSRSHRSYVVRVGNRMMWPLASGLRLTAPIEPKTFKPGDHVQWMNREKYIGRILLEVPPKVHPNDIAHTKKVAFEGQARDHVYYLVESISRGSVVFRKVFWPPVSKLSPAQ
jgi:hypothetical protein